MKIRLITDTWEPEINGVVRTLRTTMTLLRRQGHDVEVLHPGQFASVPFPFYPDIRMAYARSDDLGRSLDDADCVHLATEGPLGMAAQRWLLRHKRPYTSSYHTDIPAYLWRYLLVPPRFTYRVLRYFHSRSRKVLVSTASLAATLTRWGFRNLARWGRGVDTDLFRPKERRSHRIRPQAVYVGRVACEKNIEAFLNLDRPIDKIVVGEGPQRAELQRRYPQVPFLGAKHGVELVQAYADADVLVFPSQTDTFGIVMLEALACGTPVAAFPVTGPIDVIGGINSVGALNHDLARAVDHCLQNTDRRACREYALEHSWEKCTRQFLNHLVPAETGRARRWLWSA
jgi:glycosyltransferase involved in cell wall biosynthesis